MERPYVRRGLVALTAAGARAMLDAAESKAREIGVDQCIAIVDPGGALLAFSRMDGGRIASVQIAMTKAHSAATRRRPTKEEAGGDVLLGLRLAIASDNQVTNIGGGFPIVVDGQTIGGIGVSSGTAEEDTVVAEAALAVLV
ncbi:MAG: heme-binding protein [Candidatus Velthaea sp.]